jgi:hypothetical protein
MALSVDVISLRRDHFADLPVSLGDMFWQLGAVLAFGMMASNQSSRIR